jgi:hypothetical protein
MTEGEWLLDSSNSNAHMGMVDKTNDTGRGKSGRIISLELKNKAEYNQYLHFYTCIK